MTARRKILCALLLGVAAVLSLDAPRACADAPAAGAIVNALPLFTNDDLLLLEVRVGNTPVTDSLGAYSSRAGVYLPLGELSRLLDLAIVVDPPERSASGWVLSPQRKFTLDLNAATAEADGRRLNLGPTDAVLVDDEIYVRSDTLGKLLPMAFEANRSESSLTITPREPLPFQERMEREQRRASLEAGAGARTRQPMAVPAPYELFTAPAADFNLGLGTSNRSPRQTTHWDARLAGDVAYVGMQAYLASDQDGSPDSARLYLERRGFGKAGGPNEPVAGAGDVFTPMLGLGMASHDGRGFAFSNAPRQRASVFDDVDLRGELPTGYQVELYVNEVLRASQFTPVQGRYEFLGVPLVFGTNVVRLAFYGPRGERYEEVRRINVGGGQIGAGQTEVSFGAVDDGVPLFEFHPPDADSLAADPGYGNLTYSAMLTHGITDRLTARVGLGRYTPFVDDTRNLVEAGLAGSFGTWAAQFDYSRDDQQGQAESLGLAGLLGTVPVVLRHTEYQGGYADELSGSALDASNPLRRVSDVRTDFAARLPGTERLLPASFTVRRDERYDGTADWNATAHVTASFGQVITSGGLGYNRSARPGIPAEDALQGSLDVATILGPDWQVRGSFNFDVLPTAQLLTSGLVLDHNLSPHAAVRVGVQHDWTDQGTSSVSGGVTWRLRFMDVTLSGSYVSGIDQWSAGLTFSAGTLFDPLRHRYRGVRPGASVGGSVAVDAFVDSNGDGRRSPGEPPLAGLRSQTGEFDAASDDRGDLLVTGLGDAGTASVGLDLQSIEDPYLKPPAETLSVATRPGRVAVASFPLQVTSEAIVRFLLPLPQGGQRGLAALGVELVDAGGSVVARGRTEYDGTVLFEGLGPGRYTVRLEQSQADRLKMSLAGPVQVVVAPGGGYAGVTEARVRIAR